MNRTTARWCGALAAVLLSAGCGSNVRGAVEAQRSALPAGADASLGGQAPLAGAGAVQDESRDQGALGAPATIPGSPGSVLTTSTTGRPSGAAIPSARGAVSSPGVAKSTRGSAATPSGSAAGPSTDRAAPGQGTKPPTSPDSARPAGVANNANTDEGFTESTLKVGVTCALTGPFADLERQPCQAIQAYFRYLNDNGGVHGRKFQVLLADDEFTNAGKGAAAVRRFVEQDKVFLLDLTISPFTCSIIGNYVNQKKVPTYCTGIFTSEFSQPYIFVNMPPAIITTNHIAGQWIPSNMGKRVGLVTHSAPEWVKGGGEFRHALEKNGGQVVSEQRTALDETDYTAAVVNTRAANPEVVFLNLMPDGVLKWYLAAQRVNYRPPILNPITGEASLVPDGVGNFVLPYRCVTLLRPPERGTPAGDRFYAIMTGYYPNTDWSSIDVPTRQSYAASQIIQQALELVGPRLARATFMDILNSGREFTTGGISPPVRWEPTHTKPAYTQGLFTEFDPKTHSWKAISGLIQDEYTDRY